MSSPNNPVIIRQQGTYMRLDGEIALVTGGGSGIGQGIARRFAVEGATVAVVDKLGDRAEGTAQSIRDDGGKAIALEVDVTDESAVTSAFEQIASELGPIGILVNNAGRSIGADVTQMTVEEWDANFAVVVRSAFLCSRAVLPAMIERRTGVILNIASVNGMYGIGEEGYSAAKAGMINLTQNLATRHGKHGIRANVISPGTIATPIWGKRLAEDPHVLDHLIKWYPLGRVGVVEDIANAALFLCSKDAAWITGINLPVDGGLTAGSHLFMADLGAG